MLQLQTPWQYSLNPLCQATANSEGVKVFAVALTSPGYTMLEAAP